MTLAGDGDRLKAYTVAVGALGRGIDFDPQTDPIVRVEAGRSRNALARYYAQAGRNDPLLIDVQRGTYVPTFRRRNTPQQTKPAVSAPAKAKKRSERGFSTQAASHGRRIANSLAAFRMLADLHRQQVASMRTAIESARQTLEISYGLLQLSVNRGIACRLAPPLLPTAPSVHVKEIIPAHGRQAQRKQQTESAAAARARRPRTGGDRRHPADDGDDPSSL